MKLFSGSGHNSNKRTDNKHTRQAPRGGAEPKKSKKAGKVVLIVLLVIVVIALAVVIYWKLTTKAPDIKPPENSDNPGAEDDPTYTEERYYTLMVVGDDQEGGNTDTMMVVRLDTVENTVNVVSIPRDTTINSTLENKKINAVYHNLGGMDALLDEVEGITGFRPNNYIMVDTNVFVEVVDALGGVEFDVPIDMDYDDWSDKDNDGVVDYEFHIHVKKGLQTLSGYDALGVFRYRSTYTMGDIQRLDVQHDLLMAIAQKAMSTRNVSTLWSIASAVLDKCDTDLQTGNIQWYIAKFLGLTMDDIAFYTAPTSGCMVYYTSYVTLNTDEWITMVNETINPFGEEIKAEDCAIMSYTGGEINSKGHMVAKEENFFCTNGEEVIKNFDRTKYY